MSDSSPLSVAGKPPAATLSIHGDFLEKAVPRWLVDATPARRAALVQATSLPDWYTSATLEQRKSMHASVKASAIAQVRLDQRMATFQDVDTFARPLLLEALKAQFQVEVDVDKTLLCLRRPLEVTVFQVEVASFEVLKLPMLQAALHNFEAWECRDGAYHASSGFVVQTSSPDTFEPATLALTVSEFLSLCRSLDVGAKYQDYLKGFFASADGTLRDAFVSSQKATLRAAADQALVSGDIEPADHEMIVSVINGEIHPWMSDKQVWFNDMGLMRKRMTGCVAFVICKKYRYNDEVILYVPHDPAHPLKRYTAEQMRAQFKRLFTARDGLQPGDPSPTAYQRFFSQFVAYAERSYYFSQFTQETADSPGGPLTSPWRTIIETISAASPVTQIKELPPARAAKLEPAADPYIAPSTLTRKGRGPWADNVDLWAYLFDRHRDKVLADARSHAVPTAEVDAKARDAKLAHLLQVGLLGLNLVSMFVPVLGEVMLGVMAAQLLYETFEGSIEWAEGDKRAAKAHLIDVAENLAQLAVMAGVGAGVRRLKAARPEPVIERLSPVTLPNGQTRLWKPDLDGYESAVTLDANTPPNALGQYLAEGKTYIRLGNKSYEQVFDESIKQWRIKHPSDVDAYQPILQSNGRGAWRHSLERPLEWDRLTLLRRMGPVTEGFSDTELIKVADVSGISDNALRKMHVDHAAPPAQLSDALRLFKADTDAGQVIEQLRGTQAIDQRYLYALPLVTELPGWPRARLLEVFEGPELSGRSVKYGSERLRVGAAQKASIKISRADVLDGKLPERILAALDEQEIVGMLGAQGARVKEARPLEFSKQLNEYAQTRKPAIFDSIYTGTEPLPPRVRVLQRNCPGLSEAAAEQVLAHAGPPELKQLDEAHRVPLTLLEEARWYARQGRQTRAYAGLRSDTMASADSRRLALHCLQKLPGWPDDLRLEVRDASPSGSLLDSIGSATAVQLKYLVKKGPHFQAFNERGEALNSVSREGDNFYASLMHALPDEARRGLGVPQVGQSALLQDKLIEFADRYRSETPLLLEPQGRWFRPPVRVNAKLLGYPASGRPLDLRLNLEARARTLYPELSDDQAAAYIRRLRQAGKSDRDIFNALQNCEREYQQLASTLDQWVGQAPTTYASWSTAPDNTAYLHRAQVAQLLKAIWARAPLVGEVQHADRLSLVINDPLPPLTADFSHIRELSVGGRGMTDANSNAFLTRFPNVRTLSIGENGRFWGPTADGKPALTSLPQAVSEMRQLRRLKFKTDALSLAPDFASKLQALTALEELHIDCAGFSPTALNNLDLSALVQLKQLKFDAPHALSRWPAYVEQLPRLERLDLSNTAISALPPSLYSGHERLWAGLSLDWAKFPPQAFKPAYEYIKDYQGEQGHLMDLQQMVSDYIKGQLGAMARKNQPITLALHENLLASAPTPQARFAAIEKLSAEYDRVFESFYYPPVSATQSFRLRSASWQVGPAAELVNVLEANWWGAVAQRYGLPANVSVLELPGADTYSVPPGTPIELPPLPAGSFEHVRTLRLRWSGQSAEQTRGFIRAFSGTQTLELKSHRLNEIPIAQGDLPALTQLDLSFNQLEGGPQVLAQLNALQNLELLDLSHNPLNQLDVSALTRLKALNLRATQLQAWPTGAEGLPQLAWLDLRDNQLPTLPIRVLENDAVLMKLDLAGNRFTPTGEDSLQSARQRVENTQGLPAGALARFEQQGRSQAFAPPHASVSMAGYLLPMPRPFAGPAGAPGYTARLQRLNPALTEELALQRLAQLRSAGMGESQVDAQLTAWHQAHDTLLRQLNGWLYTRELRGQDLSAVAQERRLVALKIRQAWQNGLSDDAGTELSLHGLQVNDLPRLSTPLYHVHTLDLTGVRFSEQSAEGFLDSFPALRRLVLSGNQLTTLPLAVQRLNQLEQLELAANALSDPEPLYPLLGNEGLRRLDLSHNSLRMFNPSTFGRLEALYLNYNTVANWPSAALTAPALHTLDLSGNALTSFAYSLLDGRHEELVTGTDLVDNHQLSLNALRLMRAYSDSHLGGGGVMGLTREEIDTRIAALESDSDSGSGSSSGSDSDSDGDSGDSGDDAYAPLEIILDPAADTSEAALATWLVNVPEPLAAARREAWVQLSQEPGHAPFFHLLAQLRHTPEYEYTRADFTRRVWAVIDAAVSSAQQREPLFVASQTHATCIDGRILTFSAMEVLVFEENVLRGVPGDELRLRGQRLLNLSRQLFRLDRVDSLAEANAKGMDRAEVRLHYRVGMTRGWPDGLELPGQPSYMAFATPISGPELLQARTEILAAEASEAFYESLLARDYWLSYLRERHGQAFEALEENARRRQEALEDEYSARQSGTESQERYEVALNLLEIELGSARAQKLLELSRQEVQELSAGAAPTPRPASPQPGPSSRH